jgi:hypothetical protein
MQHNITNNILKLIEKAGKLDQVVVHDFTYKPWSDKNATFFSYGGYEAALSKISDQVMSEINDKKKKVVIACNSKKKVEELYLMFKGKCAVLSVHSGNSDSESQSAFFDDPTGASKHYDLIIISPKVTSEISIVNPTYTTTFGIYINMPDSLSPDDFVQMLGRNRCAKNLYVSVIDPGYSVPTDKLQIAKSILKLNKLQINFAKDCTDQLIIQPYQLTWIDNLKIDQITLSAEMTNKAEGIIMDMLGVKGLSCLIKHVSLTEVDKEIGKVMNKENKEKRINLSVDSIINAVQINANEMKALKLGNKISSDQHDSISRYYLENTTGIDVSKGCKDDVTQNFIWWSENRVHTSVANIELAALISKSQIKKTLSSFINTGYNPTSQSGLLFIKWGILKKLMKFFKILYEDGVISYTDERFRFNDFLESDCSKFISNNVDIVNMCGLGCQIRELGFNNKVLGLWLSKGLGLKTKAVNKRMGFKNDKGKDVFMRYYKIAGLQEGVAEIALSRFKANKTCSKALNSSTIKSLDKKEMTTEERIEMMGIKVTSNVKSFIKQMSETFKTSDIIELLLISGHDTATT